MHNQSSQSNRLQFQHQYAPSVIPRVREETLRVMNYYSSKFKNRVDSIVSRSIMNASPMMDEKSSTTPGIVINPQREFRGDYQDTHASASEMGSINQRKVSNQSDLPLIQMQQSEQPHSAAGKPSFIPAVGGKHHTEQSIDQSMHDMSLMAVEQLVEQEHLETNQDQHDLLLLKTKLKNEKIDLYSSSLPTKRFTKKLKDKPLVSNENLQLRSKRKALLNTMSK